MFGLGRKRKRMQQEAFARAYEIGSQEDKGAILNRCATNAERTALCLQWSAETRDKFYQGRRETIQDMLLSKDPRYDRMPAVLRETIGDLKWGKSAKAKELIGLEQMYSRWASQYKNAEDRSA